MDPTSRMLRLRGIKDRRGTAEQNRLEGTIYQIQQANQTRRPQMRRVDNRSIGWDF